MISRVYRGPVRRFADAVGLHPTLRALYHRTRPDEYLVRYDRAALREQCAVRYEFGDTEQIEIGLPTLVPNREMPPEFVKVSGQHELAQPFVAEIHDARVLKHSGICATADGTLLLETVNSREGTMRSYFKQRQLEASRQLLNQQLPFRKRRFSDFDVAVSLIPAPYREDRSYYTTKWIQSYLTRLQGVYYCMDTLDVRPKLLLEPDPQPYKVESLKLLGFDEDDIVRWNPDEELQINRLLVPSVRRIEKRRDFDRETRGVIYKLLSPDACQWLREKMRAQLHNGNSYSSKIFISREDANERNIVNRDEVLDYLMQQGYESYVLSKMSFTQQAELFAQAERIVAPHGGGLTNIMFAQDCEIVEIFGAKIKPTFYLQAQALNLKYRGTLQTVVGDNIRVDVQELGEIITN